jgi:hypothetical protein
LTYSPVVVGSPFDPVLKSVLYSSHSAVGAAVEDGCGGSVIAGAGVGPFVCPSAVGTGVVCDVGCTGVGEEVCGATVCIWVVGTNV